MFHVRRRPADAQPRRRKKKPLSGPNGSTSGGLDWSEGPALIEMGPHGQQLEGGRRIRISLEPLEVSILAMGIFSQYTWLLLYIYPIFVVIISQFVSKYNLYPM